MAYTAFTWAEIRQRIKDRLELKRFWTDDEILVAFNEALSLWNWCTGYWRDRITMATPISPGQPAYLYSLDGQIIVYGTRITFNNLPMSPTNRTDLNHGRYQWRLDTTLTGRPVPNRPMLWAPVDLSQFYIWPADGVGGNTLTIDGVARTPVLVHDADFVDLGDQLLTTLIGYALHALLFKKGGPMFQASMPLFQTFLQQAAEQNDQIKTSMVYRRVMGLDDRGFKPLRGKATLLDAIAGRTP